MDYTLFCKIIDEAAALAIRRIHLYLHGEPMLHREIIKMIAYTKARSIGMHVTTNGMLIDEVMAKAVLDAGVDSADHFRFSILGGSRQVHEMIMRGVAHDKVVQNIDGFLRLREHRQTSGPVVEAIMYLMPENEHEQEAFLRFWTGKVDHATVVGRVSQYFADRGKREDASYHRQMKCRHIWERLTVFWNGDVTVCCMDVDGEFVVGSLKEDSVADVWNGDRLSSIRGMHREGRLNELPFCDQCDF